MMEILLGTVLIIALILLLTAIVMGARNALLPSSPVEITVNGSTIIRGTTGQKLLSLLNAGGVPVPSGCAGAGTCGLCRVTVPSGAGAPLPTETALLGRKASRAGVRLACQVTVRNAFGVQVPQSILAAERWTCQVVSNTMLAPLIKELVLAVPQGQPFSFTAGAYVQVAAPAYDIDFSQIDIAETHEDVWRMLGWRKLKSRSKETVTRAYSIASTPANEGTVVLNIRLAVPPPGADVPPGVVSTYLFSLEQGDSVEIAGPFGEFRALDTAREMVLIGGGVGMAPLRAIIFDQLERVGSGRTISYWYGARSAADIFYRQAFDDLATKFANFKWVVALSEPAETDDWSGAEGFIHDVVLRTYLREHPDLTNCEFYLCGPPLMIQAVLAMLEDVGVDPSMIFNDDFGS